MVKIDQDLLSFCRNIFGSVMYELVLSDLIGDLTEVGRPADALTVAGECFKQFPESPYCAAASADAFHELGRNSEARAAAAMVTRRGPDDAQTEAMISKMRALIDLINIEEQLRRSTT